MGFRVQGLVSNAWSAVRAAAYAKVRVSQGSGYGEYGLGHRVRFIQGLWF